MERRAFRKRILMRCCAEMAHQPFGFGLCWKAGPVDDPEFKAPGDQLLGGFPFGEAWASPFPTFM